MAKLDTNENVKQWVSALRSGEYEQARGFLREEDRFCCLGVACDLHAKATGNQWSRDPEGASGTEYTYLKSYRTLPAVVIDWLGLKWGNGHYEGIAEDSAATSGLAYQNDGGADFNDIADIIESNPPGLFA